MKKGSKHTEETKKKISDTRKRQLANKQIIPWNKGKKGSQIAWNKGLSADPNNPNYDPRVEKNLINAKESWRLNPRLGIEPWNKGETKETDPRLVKLGENSGASRKGRSRAYVHTEEKWSEIGRMGYMASRGKTKQTPNNQELRLEKILKPHGFILNRNHKFTIEGQSTILGRERSVAPDLYHRELPILVESDGYLGHNPKSPYFKPNKKELDEERNEIYYDNGYKLIIVSETDHELTDEEILEKVLIQFLEGKDL